MNKFNNKSRVAKKFLQNYIPKLVNRIEKEVSDFSAIMEEQRSY